MIIKAEIRAKASLTIQTAFYSSSSYGYWEGQKKWFPGPEIAKCQKGGLASKTIRAD